MLPESREKLYKEISVIRASVYEIKKIEIPNRNRIFAIEEWKNPTGSTFDRIYPILFQEAEEKGYIVAGITPVIEASTGNAGAAFAKCATLLGYKKCTVITHKDTPQARVEQIKEYGCEVVFSPAGEYAKGYVKKLEEILNEDKVKKGGKIGENPHRLYCVTKISPSAKKAFHKLMQDTLFIIKKNYGVMPDFHVGVVGSGTTISGSGEYLKATLNSEKVIVVEPSELPMIQTLKAKGEVLDREKLIHEIYGIAPFGLPPEKLDINLDIIDDFILLPQDTYKEGEKLLHGIEEQLVGRSSCLTLMACLKMAKKVKNKIFLMFFYDPAWKYTDSYPHLK